MRVEWWALWAALVIVLIALIIVLRILRSLNDRVRSLESSEDEAIEKKLISTWHWREEYDD